MEIEAKREPNRCPNPSKNASASRSGGGLGGSWGDGPCSLPFFMFLFVLGAPRELLERIWGILRASWGHLGVSWACVGWFWGRCSLILPIVSETTWVVWSWLFVLPVIDLSWDHVAPSHGIANGRVWLHKLRSVISLLFLPFRHRFGWPLASQRHVRLIVGLLAFPFCCGINPLLVCIVP